MKRKILLIVLVSCLAMCQQKIIAQSIAPNVINSTGTGGYVVAGNPLFISVGENMISTVIGSNGSITQGFLQPNYIFITGIANIDSPKFIKVYPIPATVSLHLEYKGVKIIEYQIINQLGQIVGYSNIISGTIDISRLSNGIYSLRLFIEKDPKPYHLKFIKI
jgi:hypothetical protein